MNQFTITTELINKVLAYLGTRPYAESSELITAIQGEYQNEIGRQKEAEYLKSLKPNQPDTDALREESKAIYNNAVAESNRGMDMNLQQVLKKTSDGKKPKNIA